jgi:hypothetical protein
MWTFDITGNTVRTLPRRRPLLGPGEPWVTAKGDGVRQVLGSKRSWSQGPRGGSSRTGRTTTTGRHVLGQRWGGRPRSWSRSRTPSMPHASQRKRVGPAQHRLPAADTGQRATPSAASRSHHRDGFQQGPLCRSYAPGGDPQGSRAKWAMAGGREAGRDADQVKGRRGLSRSHTRG